MSALGEAATPLLTALLGSTNADRRWWAVRTRAQQDAPRADLLVNALLDIAPTVRAAAALALAGHPAEGAIAALAGALEEADSIVASLCMHALLAKGKPATPGLMEAFPTASARARIEIMRTLAQIRDVRAIALMLNATEQDSALVNYWAREGLERLGLNMVYLKPE